MQVRELKVGDAFEFTPAQHHDERGLFLEAFAVDSFERAVGHSLRLAQVSCSVSAQGVIRGIHFAQVPPSQAKYVTCPSGAVLDVVVDLRVGSPTFGEWDSVRLDDVDRRSVYVAEGLGHAFVALTDKAVVSYLCSESYSPGREHGIDPMDPDLGITWPDDVERVLSPKDAGAPSLAAALDAGLLPSHDHCLSYYEHLRRVGPGSTAL